jgi:lipopolysaccharide/colanic/teichoic acid biosynthesis glycosyltransferase
MSVEAQDIRVQDLARTAIDDWLTRPTITSTARLPTNATIGLSATLPGAEPASPLALLLSTVEPYIVRGCHERWLKPLFDRLVAAALLLVAMPVVLVAALALRPQIGPGGVFLHQVRVGRDGRPFRMLKLRTMRPDRRARALPYEGPDRRRAHKTAADPRHTPRGRVVRKLSIDELPQLWNVVKGEMSLVGPRPELVALVEREGLFGHPRHRVKPGITGPWQISEDRNRPLYEHLERDIAYMLHITMWGDLSILVRTVRAVVRGHGS